MMESYLHERNEALLKEIGEDAKHLHQLALEIGRVTREQNQFLDGAVSRCRAVWRPRPLLIASRAQDDKMRSASSFMGSTMHRLQRLLNSGQGSHMCLMAGFALFVFLFIYLFKYRL